MAGELNGTNCLLKKGTNTGSDLVGQMEMTIAFGGTPIDISNKSYADFVTLLNGELAGKQITTSGTLVYNSDSTYDDVKNAALSGTIEQYSFVWSDGKYITADFMPNAPSDSNPHGDKVSTSITFLSSGAFSAPTALVV